MNEPKTGTFCPICKHKNPLGLNACQFCGAPLPHLDSTATTRYVEKPVTQPEEEKNLKLDEKSPPVLIPSKGISIYLDEQTPIVTWFEEEFYLGRKIENGDGGVDLIPYGAFLLGVSRQHAVIRATKTGYEIIDTDSTNGTWLNGERLIPNQAYPIASGETIRLGHLQLIVYYTSPSLRNPARGLEKPHSG
jgi:hypothetical protein